MSADISTHDAHPMRIGRYRVLRHVATGGMAAVYRARDVVESKDVALKVLAPQWVEKPNALERFRREARLGRLLNHENIVAYLDSGEDAGFHYHAMEYVSGIDLNQYVRNRGRLDVPESRFLLIQAARALDHLYSLRIVHRDIKPANLLVTLRENQPFLKLIDLGLARHLEEESLFARPGTTVGTLDYIAPEQAQDRNAADVRSDIYALGCTWYHLLTGSPPFVADTAQEKMALRLEADAPDVRESNPDVPLAVVEVLHRMMARNQSFRYQSPADLLHDLETLAISGPLPARVRPSHPNLSVKTKNEPATRGWGSMLAIIVALIVLALVAVAVVWRAL